MTERAEAAAAEYAMLNRKKRSRTGHRASTTHLVNQATTAWGAATNELQLTKELLLEKINTLKSLDAEIAELEPKDELKDEIQQADQHMYLTIAKALGTCRASYHTLRLER